MWGGDTHRCGGNDFYGAVAAPVGWDTAWVALRRHAFALPDPNSHVPALAAQVAAGLHLYVETARLLGDTVTPEDAPVIAHTVGLIESVLRPSVVPADD